MINENLQSKLKLKLRRFGNILIVFGIIPLAVFVLDYILNLLNSSMDIIYILGDFALVVMLVLLIVNNKNVRDMMKEEKFNSYFQIILIYCVFSIAHIVLMYIIIFLMWDFYGIPIFWIVYDAIRLVATIFAMIAWLKLNKFGISLRTTIGKKIQSGSIILVVGFGIFLLVPIMDVSYFFVFDPSLAVALLEIFGLISAIVNIIGYIISGNHIKQMGMFPVTPDGTLDVTRKYQPT